MSSAPNHGAVDVTDTGLSSKTVSAVSVAAHVQQIFSHVKIGNLIAGLSGGVVSTLVLHPLDLVKIRFAGMTTPFICRWGFIAIISYIFRTIHFCRFMFRTSIRKIIPCCFGIFLVETVDVPCHAMWHNLIKFLCLAFNVVSDGLDLRPKYTGLLHCMKSVWAQEGLRGLYQGVTPNVWGAGASWGLYFLLYVNYNHLGLCLMMPHDISH